MGYLHFSRCHYNASVSSRCNQSLVSDVYNHILTCASELRFGLRVSWFKAKCVTITLLTNSLCYSF